MYFITEQFYQLPTEGIISVLTAAFFGQNATTNTKNEEARPQPRLLDLHLAQLNQRSEERRRRQQG